MQPFSFLQLCLDRRSCRKYDDKRPVPREILQECIEAARLAPSACNSQPWHYIVIDTPELKNKLAQAAFSGIYSMNSFAKSAPVLIVIVRESPKYAAQMAGILRQIDYSLIDLGITGEHLILQATEEGLGTCWLGWFDINGVRKCLGLPKTAKVDAIISLGYPLELKQGLSPRKEMENMCEFR